MVRRRRVLKPRKGLAGWLGRWLMIDWSDESVPSRRRTRRAGRILPKRITWFLGFGPKKEMRVRRVRRVRDRSMAAFYPGYKGAMLRGTGRGHALSRKGGR